MEEKDKKKTAKKPTNKKTTTKKSTSKKEQTKKTSEKKTNTSKKTVTAKKPTASKNKTIKKTPKASPSNKVEIVKIEEPQKTKLSDEDIKIILESEKKSTKNLDNTESIYLTKSFKTLEKTSIAGHVIKKILLYIIILSCLVGLSYYVIYPFIIKKLIINPNDKINEIITKIVANTEELIDAYIPSESFTINSTIEIESNDEEYSYLNNYKYQLINDINTKNKLYHNTLQIKNNNTEIEYKVIKENNETYINFDDNQTLYNIKVEDEGNITKEDNITTKTNNISKESIKNLMNENISFIKDIIQNEKINKGKDTISINNKNLNLTKYQISISENKQKEYIKKYEKEILTKKEVLDTLSSITNKNKEEIIDYLYKKVDGELKINIYLDKDYNFKGIDIEQNGFRTLYYYQDQDEFNIHFKTSKDNPVDIKGTNKDGCINSIIYYQNKKKAVLNINKITKEELDIYLKTNNNEIQLNKKVDSDYKLSIIHTTESSKTTINSTIKIEDKEIKSVLKNYLINDNSYNYNEARRYFINKLNQENLTYIVENIID